MKGAKAGDVGISMVVIIKMIGNLQVNHSHQRSKKEEDLVSISQRCGIAHMKEGKF
ncbi:MAG: hypothetical protein INR73_03840 [Williamsia sp.]|nr:hypothetical protein [Williamsia sp.]